MASPQPVAIKLTEPDQAASADASKAPGAKRRSPIASVVARSPEMRTALAVAKDKPGWLAARGLLGDALAVGDTAVLLEIRGKTVLTRRRVGDVWQPAEPFDGDDAIHVPGALGALSVQVGASSDIGEFEVRIRKHAARRCRVARRTTPGGEDVLVLVGAELPKAPREKPSAWLRGCLAAVVRSFWRPRQRTRPEAPLTPRVTLEPHGHDVAVRRETLAEAAGYAPACDLFAAAVQARASGIVFESGPQGLVARLDVDGVLGPPVDADQPVIQSVVVALQAVAGIDMKARSHRKGTMTALVEGKSWPCSLAVHRGRAGTRIEVTIDQGRRHFKDLTDIGVSERLSSHLRNFLKEESGLIVLAAPRRGGLSTLFDGVINAADRLLREFVLLEDGFAPRAEIQNFKSFRWHIAPLKNPTDALDAALREYPGAITTCDLTDSDLAQRLVAQAKEGRLVIIGIQAADACDGIARLMALGVDPQVMGRVLLGAVGSRLVRKLCPKCRQEYLPAIDVMEKLRLDPQVDVTMFRANSEGCFVCTMTGYLGRTAACELATGRTLQAYVAKGADVNVLRKAAMKDGMASIRRDAIAKAACGVTSIEEVQRVFHIS